MTWAGLGLAALFGWFLWQSFLVVRGTVLGGVVGSDAHLYAVAAQAWLSGADPWRAGIPWPLTGGLNYFGSTPPTLLVYAPFAYLPDVVTRGAWLALDALCVALVVRRLQLAWWFVLFPPLVLATIQGNPEPVTLALLVFGGGALAPLVKPYAVAPLLGEQRWRAALLAAFLVAATLLVLPWGTFLGDRSWIASTLATQNEGDRSAWAYPVLVPLTVLALLSLGARRAGWLVVPALVPFGHLHYATLALPALSPMLAVGFALGFYPIRGLFAGVVILEAVRVWLARRVASQGVTS